MIEWQGNHIWLSVILTLIVISIFAFFYMRYEFAKAKKYKFCNHCAINSIQDGECVICGANDKSNIKIEESENAG